MVVIAPSIRRGGAYTTETVIWLANRAGRKIVRLPVTVPVQGTVDYNEDREIKRALSLEINDPTRLTPFVDYLIPETTITDAAGNRMTRAWGHYIATPPKETLTSARYAGTVEGKDITWILSVDEVPGETVIPVGTDTGAAARELALAAMDFTRVAIPDTGVLLTSDYEPDPGTSRLQAMTALLNMANWYAPWMTGDGIVTTAPWQDLATAAPNRRYGIADAGVTVVPPLDGDPDWGRLRNRVTVRNIAPDREPVYGTAKVEDPNSPLHPLNLGGNTGRPLWLSETVDDPQVETKEAAEAKAKLLLANGASFYRKLRVRTLVDLAADAHDIVELNVRHQGAIYDGTWIRRTWTVQLRRVTAVMESELYRTEKW